MFAPSTSAFVLTLPILAVANVLPRNDGGGGPTNQCPTGTLYCCNMLVAVSNVSLQLHSDGQFTKAHQSERIYAPRPSWNCSWIRYQLCWSYVSSMIITNYVADRVNPLVTCSPITLVGSAPSCIAQPACCTGTNFVNFIF